MKSPGITFEILKKQIMNYQETLNWLFAQLPMYQREATGRAEIIPYEPDAVNTDEGIVDSDIYFLSPSAGCSLWFTR